MQVGHLLQNSIGALSFGTKLPNGKFAYATGPTWTLYRCELPCCLVQHPALVHIKAPKADTCLELRHVLIHLLWLSGCQSAAQPEGDQIGCHDTAMRLAADQRIHPLIGLPCSGDDHEICEDNIPVLIRRSTFCDAFVAEARTFRIYTSWLLSMYLSQVRARDCPTG